MNRAILCVTSVLLFVSPSVQAEVKYETLSEGVQLGRIPVPENRRSRSDRRVTLAFARLVSTAAAPRAPIIFLSGGPGQAATPIARSAGGIAQFAALRAIADVILLDQRGMGQSEPSLACPAGPPTSTDAFTEARSRNADATIACFADVRARGIDLSSYNTQESADDIEDLRLALGVPKVSLLGFSYGTHLALSVIRRHSASLDRVVLIGTEGPDHTWKLPSSYETHIARLARLAAADPAVGKDVPDFATLLRGVIARFEKEPMQIEVRDARSKSNVILTVGVSALRRFLVQDFGDGSDLPYFPAMLHQLDRGETGLFAWFVEKRWNQLGGRGAAIYFSMDCASGISASRRARIDNEARTSALANEMNSGYADVCPLLGVTDLGDGFRAPVVSDVPTLFISGTLDANTPPYQAEELRWGFTSATHLVVENAGHEQTLPEPAVQRAIVDFLSGKDVRGRSIVIAPLTFVPVTTVNR